MRIGAIAVAAVMAVLPRSMDGDQGYVMDGCIPLVEVSRTDIQPPEEWTQVGLASWYGPWFEGKPMANREPFRVTQMTVAHRSLPLNSTIEITNTDNGLTVTAKVTDRGPYGDHRRILDVSPAVAINLGMWYHGLARVQIRTRS